jgi:uncharacterized protein YndB with AHSA1/START domain
MTESLRFSFDVRCAPDHAFTAWTEQISLWWPPDHTVSGSPATVVIEGRIGGRIYERGGRGDVHEWGVVTAWDPPTSLAYTWNFGVGPERATDVAVAFRAIGDDTTRVEIQQTGWERLGPDAPRVQQRNRAGWASLVPHFRAAVEGGRA